MNVAFKKGKGFFGRFANSLKGDVLLQYRSGFYFVYFFLSVLYIFALRFLPLAERKFLIPLVIFSDPAVVGFLIIGAIVILERDDGTQKAVFATPLRPWEYLLSKGVSLTILAVSTSIAIAFFSAEAEFNVTILVIATAMTSVFFILIGLVFVSRIKVFNRYLFGAGLGLSWINMPLFDYLGFVDSPLFWLFPTQPMLLLMGSAFRPEVYGTGEVLFSYLLLCGWIFVAWRWALDWFWRYELGGEGR